MKNKLNIKSLIIVLLLFLSLFRVYIFSSDEFLNISVVLSIILIVVSKPSLKSVKENIFLILLALSMFVSTYFFNTNNYSFLNGLRYSLQFFALVFVTNSLIKTDGLKETVKNYFLISLLFVIVMDITVLIGLDFDKTYYQNLVSYLFGNKFMLLYLHLQTFALMAFYGNLNNNKKDYWYVLYAIIGLLMCVRVNCVTGVVGIIVFSLMLFIPFNDKIKKALSKPISIFIMLLIVEILLFISRTLYNTSIGQYIVDLLNKGNSLNGRFIIYEILPHIMSSRFIFGYGYNSSIITHILGYGNAQNGLLQYLLDLGIVGTLLFLINLYKSVNIEFESDNWPLYCALYAFIICSLFEVCFKFNFFIILCMLFNIGLVQKNEK